MNLYKKLVQRLDAALNERSVAWRTQTLSRGIVGGFAALGAIYVGTFALGQYAEHRLEQVNRFELSLKSAETEYVLTRRNEKNFYLPFKTDKPRYLKQHDEQTAKLRKSIEQVLAMSPDEASAEKAREMLQAVKLYKDKFDISARKMIEAGYSPETGLHKQMREAINTLEDKLGDNSAELTISKLQLRRHEKDFIQRDELKYKEQHVAERAVFMAALARSAQPNKEEIGQLFNQYVVAFDAYVEAQLAARAAEKEANKASDIPEEVLENLTKVAQSAIASQKATGNLLSTISLSVFTVVLAIIAAMLTLMVTLIAKGIRLPVEHLHNTVEALAKGEDVRADMDHPDEFGELGRSFDRMIEDRNAVQRAIVEENEQLNDAVLNLLQAVAVLARKDLTHKVPVTEDVTGPVADALNLLASETAKVLQRVSDLSADVSQASLLVKEHSDEVVEVAEKEREEVEKAAKALTLAAESMTKIAAVARSANQSAEQAMKTTRQALETVNTTVSGINNTRETIRETEKRIKRLGERSQEISLAVNLINSISERTHILALNASMHAASAGEAGRGFAVVADEVQRLAENARQATQQISSLVHNIQADTAETVSAMNQAIEQVVAGSRLAEQAGQQMEVTEQNTAQLVRAVQQIAAASEAQVRVNRDLVVRTEAINASTQYTNEKLKEQAQHTYSLVEYARGLLSAVRVFKLPG
ncbi:methyl-accepting chemotaxis protein [Chitinilyticum piscinae]|uniref:HAMP domain-containing protein n=1 Tax=Chitinilyticum piscinae TaxID=2866724 RepID=A0A8J7K7T7_9NEIS|nr:HAMP domain-containing methyl-accepting chemotaxis protein [Chitinilyticum piscinae]MBE9608578.1 HAMP domain-containing protein [Chitinilyticum piscinae]